MRIREVLIAVLAAFIASSSPRAQETAVLFEHVSVIGMDSERIFADANVLVVGSNIVSIGGGNYAGTTPTGTVRVDGRGKFLMPALSEMHAHIPSDTAEAERVLFLYVANGIGTIRSMLGDPAHFRLRERVMRGDVIGPTMLLAGPSFNGQTAPTVTAATARVADQKKAGYNLLKIHPGVPRAAFDALAAAADKTAIPFAGHVPADVGLQRALEAKYWSIDHLDGYVEALAGNGAPAAQNFGVNLMARIDEGKINSLAEQTRAAGVWNVPTEVLLENWYGPDPPEVMQKWPEMRYASTADVRQWMAIKRENLASVSAQDRQRFITVRRRLIKALHDAGAGLLLGSDSPQVWNVPGFSIHRELASYVAAGLTPYQALATGTRNVAAHLGTLDPKSDRRITGVFKAGERAGTINVSARADLVLLDANPLENIANTSRIAGVMIRGRWLPKAEIDRRLASMR
jgi:imidazolonepropionase-like amidohydrolase